MPLPTHGQKHTSDLKRSLVFVSWSAWTNLRCLAGRRPSVRPRAIQGAPFRAHAHDPTGEYWPSRNGFPIHFGIRHAFRRTPPAFLLVRTVSGSSKQFLDPILSNRFSRPCESLPRPFGRGRDSLRGHRANTSPSCLATGSLRPEGQGVVWAIHPSVHLEFGVSALANRHPSLVHD